MNPKLKLTAYVVMVILCAWFGLAFKAKYNLVTKAAAEAAASAGVPQPTPNPNTNATANNSNTNATTTTTANTDTNVAAATDTNTPSTAPPSDTNAAAGQAQTNAPAPVAQSAPPSAAPVDVSSARGAMIGYLAAFVGAVIGLGILIATDFTQFIGNQAIDFLFNVGGEGERDPEYEKAESEWANGHFLDAIQMMRDYFKNHPREIYAALRIAEIYEKDLKNPLAAALEYEEILKNRLPAEKWGWSAIHLCNLYSKLNQSDKALALLKRVADEYPKTGAARKARARLGIAEPEAEPAEQEAPAETATEPQTPDGATVIVMEEHPPELEPRSPSQEPVPQAEEEPPPSAEPAKPHLPPGFRPKK